MVWKPTVVQNEIGHHSQQNVGEIHTWSEIEGGRTLNNTQKSWEELQQPKSWVKPTASPNHGLNNSKQKTWIKAMVIHIPAEIGPLRPFTCSLRINQRRAATGA